MIRIKRVRYIYSNGYTCSVRYPYMEVANKVQLEKLRIRLIKSNECEDVTFTYEER